MIPVPGPAQNRQSVRPNTALYVPICAAVAGADEVAAQEAALLRELQGDANLVTQRRAAVAEVFEAEE